MNHRSQLLAFAATIPACFAGLTSAQAEEIKPPFGLHWGETETRLVRIGPYPSHLLRARETTKSRLPGRLTPVSGL